eukprot:955089-Lingulodinium_polyedra.AAC.1
MAHGSRNAVQVSLHKWCSSKDGRSPTAVGQRRPSEHRGQGDFPRSFGAGAARLAEQEERPSGRPSVAAQLRRQGGRTHGGRVASGLGPARRAGQGDH